MTKFTQNNRKTNPGVLTMLIALVAVIAVTFSACKKEVESVALNKNALTLAVGASETLTATVTPSDAEHDALAWTSSNAAVATVDNSGKVTAVATGTATITVSVSGKTATCAVTVSQSSGTTTYRVGDLYNVGGVKGVVFEVSDGGKHGKIVAVDNITAAEYQWSTINEVTGARNENDGTANMATIKTMADWQTNYPAFKYWDDKGFYIPAEKELQSIVENNVVLNAIANNGGITWTDESYEYFCSSTERTVDRVTGFRFLSGNPSLLLFCYKQGKNNLTDEVIPGVYKF